MRRGLAAVLGAMLLWGPPSLAEDAPDRLPQWKARCGTGGAVTLDTLVTPIVEGLAEKRIRYVSSRERTLELADCSGNFLRVSSALAEACPKRADDLAILAGVPPWNGTLVDASLLRPADWIGPNDLVRTTRNTAEWYDRRGLFVPIFANRSGEGIPRRLEKLRDWFRPGTVVWFGSTQISKKDCKRSTCMEDLISNITHMGVVASVTYDDDGNPVSYAMYHGRNTQHHNGITDYHAWESSGRPAFGNGSQAVLGVAPIVKARRKR